MGKRSGDKRSGGTSPGSEDQIRTLIRKQLRPQEVLLEGIRLSDPRHGDIEVDFLVLIPDSGIAVIEVKGGDVTIKDGQWRTEYGNVKRRINPVEQARRAKHALRRYLDRQPEWTLGLVRSEWFVVMPFTTVTGDMSAEARRELLIGREDLDQLMPNIRRALDSTLNNDPAPDTDSIELALTLLLRKKDDEEKSAATAKVFWKRPSAWVGAGLGVSALAITGAALLASSTGSTPPPSQPTQSSVSNNSGACDPNYEPCIPIAPDLRCSDIKLAVTVVGRDIHGFDRDGDGIGCEVYQ